MSALHSTIGRFFVRHAARRYRLLDPAELLARLRRFAQPSEFAEPIELLRAGIVFHARGLVNAKAIQQNLDWIWPYWVEKQFNPEDPSFIPRAFSFSHVNLTHRNWTAVGMPGLPIYPIIDPRGLITPLYDGWSMDFWIITKSGRSLFPSKLPDNAVTQSLNIDGTLSVVTESIMEGIALRVESTMAASHERDVRAEITIRATAQQEGWLCAAVRPYNPEGIQFIHHIEVAEAPHKLTVNREATVAFDHNPDSVLMSHYAEGDVYHDLFGRKQQRHVSCNVGMATAAALFNLDAGAVFDLQATVTLDRDVKENSCRAIKKGGWDAALNSSAKLMIGDGWMQFLYDAALRTLVLLSADELVPGPYTYRRFWFRDACLMLHPMMVTGRLSDAGRIIDSFPSRQTRAGYFLSQEGEWDSNGQVLWIVAKYAALTGTALSGELEKSMRKGVDWLANKRQGASSPVGIRGLLPAGFSAEHLGPNDYYYWDDFWAWAGLKAIASYWKRVDARQDAEKSAALADAFAQSIKASIDTIPISRSRDAIPASPGRRMDAGAIGSMVADYPLQLYPPLHPAIMRTADYLLKKCFSQGGFFQEMIHSGINAYLTLDLAQTLLRAGDSRFMEIMRNVAKLATSTGQWPEAIHPRTFGGCMGDGQHGWAAAEWIMMIRNCFVREEEDHLVIGSGILPEWRAGGQTASFGPTLTAWGALTVRLKEQTLLIEADWRAEPPRLEIRVPGFESLECEGSVYKHVLKPL